MSDPVMRMRCSLFLLLSAIFAQHLQAQVIHSFTEPEETIEVAFAESGILHSVSVRQGSSIAQGDVLASLNVEVLQASRALALSRAESSAQIDVARVEVKLKQSQMEKLSQVLESGHASSLEIEKAQAEYESALAQLKLAEEQHREYQLELHRIDAQIEQRIMHSPASGLVVKVHKKPGEFISSSEPVLIRLVQLERLRVKFYITTDQAVELQDQLNVDVELEGKTVAGKIDFLSPITEADSGTVRLEVLLDNTEQSLRSGLPCRLLSVSENRHIEGRHSLGSTKN